jgi:hypothetical protein
MERAEARRLVLRAISEERHWQEGAFSLENDDSTARSDLNHWVAVLSKYMGGIADEAVSQGDFREVDLTKVARMSVKVAAVAVALTESLVATGRVDGTKLSGRGVEYEADGQRSHDDALIERLSSEDVGGGS